MASTDRSDLIALSTGSVLLALYVVQGIAHLEWPLLVQLQRGDVYKVVSGSVLGIYLLHQSFMAKRRVFDPIGVLVWHKLTGAAGPLLLYAHASRFGYGYLFVLTSLFIGTVGFALLHRVVLRARWLFTTWFVVHVATASSLVVLGCYHVVIALAYE